MNPTPFIGSAALLFWGFHADTVELAVILALILEIPRLIRKRWEFSVDQLNKVTDTCTVLVAATAVFFISEEPEKVLHRTLALLPVLAFPLLAIQRYSSTGTTDVRALFLFNRKRRIHSPGRTIDLAYPFVLICLVSAGTANIRTPFYLSGAIVLICLGLYFQRPERVRLSVWIVAILLSIGMGVTLQGGMIQLQKKLSRMTYRFFMFHRDDPLKRSTAIGEIGRLKLSNKILFRIKPGPGPGFNDSRILLKEASFNFFSRNTWIAAHNRYYDMDVSTTGSVRVNTGPKPVRTMTVTHRLREGSGLFKLPEHPLSLKLSGTLPDLQTNRLGPILAKHGPGLISYDVTFAGSSNDHPPPDGMDLILAPQDKEFFAGLAAILFPDRTSMDARQMLPVINAYFLKNFTYSTDLKPSTADSPLLGFMTETRQGHCEYFATATVHLLRALGLPARYVSGYLAFEKSMIGNAMVIREKHAHAWTEVYIDGKWEFFDTTPPSWQVAEKSTVLKTFLPDLMHNLSFALALIRWGPSETQKYVLWLLVPLGLIILRRLRADSKKPRRSVTKTRVDGSGPGQIDMPHSPLLMVQDSLIRNGYHKNSHETACHFVLRLKTQAFDREVQADIDAMVRLHNRLCFSRSGLSDRDAKVLSEKAAIAAEAAKGPSDRTGTPQKKLNKPPKTTYTSPANR